MAMRDVDCVIEFKKKDVSSKAIEKFLKNLDKHNTTIGIHKEEGARQINKDGFTLIKNACIQEFGNTQTVAETRRFKSPITGKWFYIKKGTQLNIPPRIFIRIFNDGKIKKDLTQVFKTQIQINLKNGDALKVYDGVGNWGRLKQKERFLNGSIKPKNAPMTVEYKGSNDPLYLTGATFSAIKHKVN